MKVGVEKQKQTSANNPVLLYSTPNNYPSQSKSPKPYNQTSNLCPTYQILLQTMRIRIFSPKLDPISGLQFEYGVHQNDLS